MISKWTRFSESVDKLVRQRPKSTPIWTRPIDQNSANDHPPFPKRPVNGAKTHSRTEDSSSLKTPSPSGIVYDDLICDLFHHQSPEKQHALFSQLMKQLAQQYTLHD